MPQAQELKRDPNLKLAFSGGSRSSSSTSSTSGIRSHRGPTSACGWPPATPRSPALSDAETLGASKPAGNFIPRAFDFALPIEPLPHNPARAKQLLAEAGYPNGFDAGELYQLPPYFSLGEAIIGNLQAVGIKLKMRPMERAAYFAAVQSEARALRLSSALYGNAARMSRSTQRGRLRLRRLSRPDALYKQQARETDRKKREALLPIQQIMNERTRIAPIFEYIWPSGIGPRVENPALMLINPYPWSAPLEDVRLKKS